MTDLSKSDDSNRFVFRASCDDAPGIVHAITHVLVEHNCSMGESQQYGDPETQRFFMRVQFVGVDGPVSVAPLRDALGDVAQRFSMEWDLRPATVRQRVLIMVSKFGHCLNDLLYRQRIGALDIEIPAVVSNHNEFRDLVESYDIPFHFIPVTPETKAAAETELLHLVGALDIDLVVLARYMQVLSDSLCIAMNGRVINIHHSFLPSFKGARPYHQAHSRGVKVIGATAHYVTADLDEGPIIEQEVVRVDHTFGPDRMVAAGRDAECQALARAVTWHTQGRILLNGNRTVVFR